MLLNIKIKPIILFFIALAFLFQNFNFIQANSELKEEDIIEKINKGQNLNQIDDNKLAETLNKNPSLANRLDDKDLVRALNKNTNLLDNPEVINDFNNRLNQLHPSPPTILNENPKLMQKYFKTYPNDINIQEGVQLKSFKNPNIETDGAKSVNFNINDHPGATITKDGELILKDNTLISGNLGEPAQVTKNNNGIYTVNNGNIIIEQNTEANFILQKGSLEYNDKTYSSTDNEDISFSITQDHITITGKDVTEINKDNSQNHFSGRITRYSDEHIVLGDNTKYLTINNDGNINFDVKKETTLITSKASQDCTGKDNCITLIDNDLVVNTKDNVIDININNRNIKSINVGDTSDSIVTTNLFNNILTFKENGLTKQGALNDATLQELPDPTSTYNLKIKIPEQIILEDEDDVDKIIKERWEEKYGETISDADLQRLKSEFANLNANSEVTEGESYYFPPITESDTEQTKPKLTIDNLITSLNSGPESVGKDFNSMTEEEIKENIRKVLPQNLDTNTEQAIVDFLKNDNVKQNIDPTILLTIIDTESSGKANAQSKDDARGLTQIIFEKGAGEDVNAKKSEKLLARLNDLGYNEFTKDKLPNQNDLHDPKINLVYWDLYFNEVIPEYLNNYGIPVNTKTQLAAYHQGIGNLNRFYINNNNDIDITLENIGPEGKKYIAKITKIIEQSTGTKLT
jgi:hypothetical protein